MSKSRFEMVCATQEPNIVPQLMILCLATSNDPWGPTGTEMSEIAQLTFNGYSHHPLASTTEALD